MERWTREPLPEHLRSVTCFVSVDPMVGAGILRGTEADDDGRLAIMTYAQWTNPLASPARGMCERYRSYQPTAPVPARPGWAWCSSASTSTGRTTTVSGAGSTQSSPPSSPNPSPRPANSTSDWPMVPGLGTTRWRGSRPGPGCANRRRRRARPWGCRWRRLRCGSRWRRSRWSAGARSRSAGTPQGDAGRRRGGGPARSVPRRPRNQGRPARDGGHSVSPGLAAALRSASGPRKGGPDPSATSRGYSRPGRRRRDRVPIDSACPAVSSVPQAPETWATSQGAGGCRSYPRGVR